MVFPVVGGNESKGYDVENSLRFNSGDSARLTEDFSSASRQTFTFSTWFKRGKLSTTMSLLSSGTSNSDRTSLFINSDDTVRFFSSESDAVAKLIKSNAVLRDPSAWYHLVLRYDSTQSTNTDRIRFYLNGSEMTYQSSPTYPAQNNSSIYIGSDDTHGVGCLFYGSTATEFFDGYMAETHYIDGTSYDHTQFGEFNDNGVWIPKKYTGGYGTNGFYLEFKQTGTSANSSGIGADTSGNDNHFTPTNLAATDITEDTCTNNFATLVPTLNMTLSEGNVKATTSRTSYWDGIHASIGVTSGKWYFETKASNAAGTFRVKSGVVGNPETFTILYNGRGASGDPRGTLSNTYPSYGKGVWLENWYDEDYDSSSTASAQSSGDILQFALDMDNYKMWVGVNGQFKDNSNNNVSYSDVASGNSATVTIPSAAYTGKTFFPDVWLRDDDGSFDNVAEVNFGNPSFSISSGNTDGKYGNFEYAVPSGFYALCTKRLAEFG